MSTETYLFDLELRYRPDAAPMSAPEGRIAARLAGGDGTARGPALSGTVRWDLYERTGEESCEMAVAGLIQTPSGFPDGFEVRLDAVGFGHVPDPSRPNLWRISATLRFGATDAGHQGLSCAPLYSEEGGWTPTGPDRN